MSLKRMLNDVDSDAFADERRNQILRMREEPEGFQ